MNSSKVVGMMTRAAFLFSFLLLASAAGCTNYQPNAAALDDGRLAAPFANNEKVVFFGDSITHGGKYHGYLQLLQALRAPTSNVRVINGGVSGDSAGGGLIRWEWDIKPMGATTYFLMMGMNDVGRGNYKTVAPANDKEAKGRQNSLDNYRKTQTALTEKMIATGAKIYLMTPTPYDQYGEVKAENLAGCNEPGLANCAKIVRELAAAKSLSVIDLHPSLTQILKDNTSRRFLADRVHPGWEGHLLIAAEVAQALNVSPIVSAVSLGANAKVLATLRAEVSDAKCNNEGIEFTYTPQALPFPVMPEYEKDAEIYSLTEKLNREIIAIAGLVKGRYALYCDGKQLGEWDEISFERGINIATLETPNQLVAQKVAAIAKSYLALGGEFRTYPQIEMMVRGKANIDYDEDVFAFLDKRLADMEAKKLPWAGYYKNVFTNYRKIRPMKAEKAKALDARWAEIYAAAKPVSCKFEVRKVSK